MSKPDVIADVDTIVVAGERWGWVIVRVRAEDGLCGIGEASLEGREQTIVAAVSELRRVLVGKDARQINSHMFAMYREPIWAGGPILQCAISGIDMALWDLKAKRLEVPVYELLGGATRSSLRMYANGWWYEGGTPDDVAAAARAQMELGFSGVKFNPFNRQPDTQPFYLSPRVLRTGIDYVDAVRQAIGPDADLFIDLNASFLNTGDALRVIEALKPFEPGFVEEPLAQESIEAMADLRSRTTVPIATGERLFTAFDFEKLIGAAATDVAQPDLCHCGGLTAALKVSAMAEMRYVPIAPHNPNGPICESATAHLATAIPNFMILEHFPAEDWRAEVVGTPYRIADGYLTLSDSPGLGIDFNEAAARARPYVSRDLSDFHERNFTGGD